MKQFKILQISIAVLITLAFMFRPANNSISQATKTPVSKAAKNNEVLKDKVDAKADSVLKKLDEISKAVDDKPKYKVRWRTRPPKIVYVHDTITVFIMPADTSEYIQDEPEVKVIVDTVYIRDTVKVKEKSFFKRIFQL